MNINNEINKQILLNQLSILAALQRLEYKQNGVEIIGDLGERIKETQTLENKIMQIESMIKPGE